MMPQIYDRATLESYKVNRPGEPEVIRQRLYDYQLYATAGSTQMTFFALPLGQGMTSSSGAVAGSPKTYADTNMETAGQLPRPKNYLLESIEVYFEPGSVSTANTFTIQTPVVFNTTAAAAVLAQITDVNAIRVSGYLELYIGSKTYLTEAPLGAFPMKTRMELDAAIGLAGTNAQPAVLAAVNARTGGRPYYMDPPIVLETSQNFAVYLKWPVAIATVANNGRIGVIFDGVMYRLSQ